MPYNPAKYDVPHPNRIRLLIVFNKSVFCSNPPNFTSVSFLILPPLFIALSIISGC
jgi:hypothetical protein